MKRVFGGVLLLAVCAAGCGETPIPTEPTRTSLFASSLSGNWLGDLQLVRVLGGECVGADLQADLDAGRGLDEGTVAVEQTGAQMTAIVRSQTTGLTCSYAGTAGVSLFALSAVSCDDKEVFFRCTNGEPRVLDLLGSTMNAFARGGEASGVVASSYNVSVLDDQGTKKPVAGLTLQYEFAAVRP
jgi:hypothetical protein